MRSPPGWSRFCGTNAELRRLHQKAASWQNRGAAQRVVHACENILASVPALAASAFEERYFVGRCERATPSEART